MAAKKGGHAVQQKYQPEGRRPTAAVSCALMLMYELAKKKVAAKERRWEHGMFSD